MKLIFVYRFGREKFNKIFGGIYFKDFRLFNIY